MANNITTSFGGVAYSTTAKFGTGSKGPNWQAQTSATPTFAASSTGTIEFWYNTSSTQSLQMLLELTASANTWIGLSSGKLTASWMGGSAVTLSATNTADGSWHHFAITFNGTVATVFQDGASVGAFNATTNSTTWAAMSGVALQFGGFGGNDYFAGEMDELAIWSTIQYAGSTYTVPTSAFSAIATGLIGLFPFEQPSPLVNMVGFTPVVTISAPFISGILTGGITIVSGTFSYGAPTGLSQVLNGATTAVASPTITTTAGAGATAYGTYSYTLTTPAAGSQSLQVNGTGSYAATGSATTFTTGSGELVASYGSAVFETNTVKFGSQAKAPTWQAETFATPTFGVSSTGTIEFWYNTTATTTYQMLVSFNETLQSWIGLSALGQLTASWKGSGSVILSATNTADGNWHHFAITFSGTVATVFQDGVSVGVFDAASVGATWGGMGAIPLQFYGLNPSTSNFNFPGFVDEIAIWSTIQYTGSTYTVPTAAFSPTAAGLVGLYTFEQPDPLANTVGVVPPPTISAPTVSGLTVGGTTTVSGTFTDGTPTGLSQILNGATTTVSSPTITTTSGSAASASGNYSYTISTPAAGANIIQVNGTGSYAATGSSTGFTTVAAGAPTISAPSVGGLIAGGTTTVSGTFANGAPTGLTYSLDGTSVIAVSSPIITTTSGSATTAVGTYSFTTTTPTAGAHTLVVNGTGTYASVGSSTPFTTVPTGLNILPNNAAFLYSPYNWGAPNSSSAIAYNTGAYCKILFSGNSCVLNFNLSGSGYPLSQIWWRIDQGPWTQSDVASTIVCTIPIETYEDASFPYHRLEWVFKSMAVSTLNPWTVSPPQTAIVFNGITVDSGASVVAPVALPRNILIYGDSITQGVLTLDPAAALQPDQDDAMFCWSYAQGALLGAEVGVVGWGGTGYVNPATAPALTGSYNLLCAGVSRIFTPVPDLIIINAGVNDPVSTATETAAITVINGLLAACPTSKIALVVPFEQGTNIYLQAAQAGCSNPNRVHYVPTTGFDNTAYGGSLHPTGTNSVMMIAPRVAAALAPILSGIKNPWTHY